MTRIPTSQEFHFGDFTLDAAGYRLLRGTKHLPLEKLPMQLLILLVERRGELLSRDEIAEQLWGKDVFLEIDHSINTAIRKIRLALRDDPEKPRYVETVFGRGYRFAAPVTCSGKAEGGSPSVGAERSPQPLVPIPSRRPNSLLVKGLITAAAVALIMAAFAIWHLRSPKTDAAQVHIQSIAVLPFQNLSGNASQEYLADGLSEELTARLASIRGLRVTSRTSARQFKDSKQSAPEIAKTLGVDALVEGSVIREGNRVRVHAQLIRGTTDEHMWAASYDREMRDALPLEGELAQTIAEKIRITTTGDEHTRLTRAPVVDPEVYENYLKGRYSGAKSRAELEQSIRYFEDSIRKDPTFAPAYVGMAEAYETLGTIFIGERPEITRPKVMWASQKALELDPSLIEAHTLLARVYQETWRWADAENENRRALDLNPNDGNAHLGMAKWLLSHGRIEEALQESERAHQLDPFGVSGIMGGWILYQGRRYDEALRQLRSVPPEHPDYANAQFFLGFVLLAKGQRDEAVSVLEHTLELTRGGIGVRAMLIHAYVQSGQREKALRMVNELKQQRRTGYVPAGAFVNIYAGMKDREQTLFWLEKAAEEHSNILQFIKTHPHFDFIRDDPRFQELVQRVGLQ